MPITNTTTDYTGRTLDIYISTVNNLVAAPQPVLMRYTFGNPSHYIAGVQKLIQRYTIKLMNSGFVEDILGSNNTGIADATHKFNLYSWGVIQEFQQYQNANPGLPADEQLQTVQLSSVSTSTVPVVGARQAPGVTVSFKADLLTVAGTNIPFVLPLSII